MQKTPNKNLQDLFKTYVAKSGDEEKFRKAHVTTVVDNNDKNLGPKEDQFVATNKVYPRDASHHGYDVGGDEKVYSEEIEIDEASSVPAANKYSSYKVGGVDVTSDVSDILKSNPTIKNPNMIRVGQTIKLGGQDYTVKKGDTLSGIAASRRSAAPPAAAPKVDAPAADFSDVKPDSGPIAPKHDDHTPGYENKSPKQIRADARAAIRTQRIQAKVARLEKSRGADFAAAYGNRKMADVRGDVEKAYGHQSQADQAYGQRAQFGRELNRIRRGQAAPTTPARAAPAPAPAAPTATPMMNINQRRAASHIAEAMTAKDRYVHHHGHAKALLKSIADHLDREGKEAHGHTDFRGNKGPSWGHVGSMEHVAKQLGDIHDMLARQGEYAQSSKIAEEAEQIDEVLDTPEKKKEYLQHMFDKGNILRKAKPASIKAIKDKAMNQFKADLKRGGGTFKPLSDADRKINKRVKYGEKVRDKLNSQLAREEVDLEEKKLTPAEMKKREEVAQAIERDNPDMPMSKKMAIATAQAKKVAEEIELGESVMSDDAFDHLEKAGAEDVKTTSGGIHYKAGGKEYKLRHDMKRSGHRTVRTAELKQHLDRLKALKESVVEDISFKHKMLNKGYNSLLSILDEDTAVDE